MTSVKEARVNRTRRHLRVRKKVSGTATKPRLCVFRSLKHIYAQLLDDSEGRTLVSASSFDTTKEAGPKSKSEDAKLVGTLLGKRALDIGVEQVVFDRGGYRYHGRVKILADAAREAGLKF
ncbi:MAG: 50S ribosomal protein L18 [Dehalococcoidia bacterium]|nr:50S ribosomal protein L18 [Dehalococcoidia bacterium]